MGRGPHCSSWVSHSTESLPRLLCGTVGQQRLAQPSRHETRHHKRLCTCFFLGLAFSLQGAEIDSTAGSTPAAANVPFVPTECPCCPQSHLGVHQTGRLLVETPWQRGNGIREVTSKACLDTSHFRHCSSSVPAVVKRTFEGIAHLLTEQS